VVFFVFHIKSKTSPIVLYNIHHRQNPFKVKINLKVEIGYSNSNCLKFTWKVIYVFHFFPLWEWMLWCNFITVIYCGFVVVRCMLMSFSLAELPLFVDFLCSCLCQCGACGCSWSLLCPSQVLYYYNTMHTVHSAECWRLVEVIKKTAVTQFLSKLRWQPKLVGLHQSRISIITVLDAETLTFKIALKFSKVGHDWRQNCRDVTYPHDTSSYQFL
jgi:hypothetical protein